MEVDKFTKHKGTITVEFDSVDAFHSVRRAIENRKEFKEKVEVVDWRIGSKVIPDE